MRCRACGGGQTRVVDSRPAEGRGAVRRRRECPACGHRFTTFERPAPPVLRVLKRDGTVEPFDRAKVLEGLGRAAEGRISRRRLEQAAEAVEAAIRAQGPRVSSEQVGLMVLTHLRDLDQVAYVRFASVYKDFQGPEDFEKELHSLRK